MTSAYRNPTQRKPRCVGHPAELAEVEGCAESLHNGFDQDQRAKVLPRGLVISRYLTLLMPRRLIDYRTIDSEHGQGGFCHGVKNTAQLDPPD